MKKVLSILISLTFIFLLTFSSSASFEPSNSNTYSSVEYFEDGSYLEIVIIEELSTSLPKETRTSKLGSKKLTYKNANDETEWSATISGTFTYNGSSCTCTSSSISYSIENTKWKIPSATASKSGNKAIGNVTAKYYVLGVLIKTVEKSVTLTCSATGVLS